MFRVLMVIEPHSGMLGRTVKVGREITFVIDRNVTDGKCG